jgi:hypothetical protein
MDETNAPVQLTKFCDLVREIENLERYYDAKVQAGGSRSSNFQLAVHLGTKSVARPAVIDSCSMDSASYHSSGYQGKVQQLKTGLVLLVDNF